MSATSTIDTSNYTYRMELVDTSGNAILGTGGMQVVGNVAAGTADSGNGVKVSGVYNSSAPTLTTGQRGDLQLDASGNLKVNIASGTVGGTQYTDAGSSVPHPTGNALIFFNGSSIPTAVTSANPLPVTSASPSTFGSAFPSTGTPVGFTDGTNMRAATVAIFHNADNQSLGGSSYGLLTGGVAQILNPSNTLDRQRGTGFDGIGATGVATGTQQLAGALLTTTSTTSITGNTSAQNVVVVSSANMVMGDQIKIVDNASGIEYTEVLSIPDATHFNAIVKNSHTQPLTFSWNHFNQAKDATVGDNVALTGLNASSNYLINPIGNADKQKEAGFDNVTSIGISSSTNLNAVPVSFNITQTITGSTNVQTVTVNSTTNLQVGQIIYTTKEYVKITALVVGTSISGIFTQTYSSSPTTCSTFYYVQQRDASIGDNQPLLGQNISVTGLWNPTTSLVELERSALGANDNDNGKGAAIAVEYEYNGQGYDRGRNLQSKGFNSASITSGGTSGTNTATFASTPTGLQAGAAVQLLGGVIETAYVALNWTPSATVTFQSNIAQTGHTTMIWETFTANGPGLNGFTPIGIGIEEDSVYDPVTGYFYIERSSTQDAVSGQNLVMENEGLYNGSTFDRSRGSLTGAQSAATGFANELEMIQYNTTTPTLTNGQLVNTQADVNGNLKVTPATLLAGEDLTNNVLAITQRPVASASYSPAVYINAGSVISANVKASLGNILSLEISNISASLVWLQFFNSTSAPSAGNTAIINIPVPAGTSTVPGMAMRGQDFFRMGGLNFTTGISYGISTTNGTYTAATTASNFNLNILYV